MQLLLIFGINTRLGISNFLFALGDDALASFVVGIQFLPLCVVYLKYVPTTTQHKTKHDAHVSLLKFGCIPSHAQFPPPLPKTRLCPGGSEGAVYAMLTTFGNVALLAGNSLGTLFASLWDVSNAALRRGELGGLWKLTVLTSCLSPSRSCSSRSCRPTRRSRRPCARAAAPAPRPAWPFS